jgi:hypothetical protein
MEQAKKCCICGVKIQGYGNNPYPVREDGECCDSCNTLIVIPARILRIKGGHQDER